MVPSWLPVHFKGSMIVTGLVRGSEMDDNIWEYPFGELDDDEDMFYREPERLKDNHIFILKPGRLQT